MNTRKVDEYVKRLKRRSRYLEQNSGDTAHYAWAELTALDWAIRYIEDTEIDAADHLTEYFEKKKENINGENKIHDDGDHTYRPIRQHSTEH